jgi:hypothetical protein
MATTNVNASLARLQAALRGEPEPWPKGFKSVEQFAAEWHVSRNWASSLLNRAVARGLYIRQPARVSGKAGFIYREK